MLVSQCQYRAPSQWWVMSPVPLQKDEYATVTVQITYICHRLVQEPALDVRKRNIYKVIYSTRSGVKHPNSYYAWSKASLSPLSPYPHSWKLAFFLKTTVVWLQLKSISCIYFQWCNASRESCQEVGVVSEADHEGLQLLLTYNPVSEG